MNRKQEHLLERALAQARAAAPPPEAEARAFARVGALLSQPSRPAPPPAPPRYRWAPVWIAAGLALAACGGAWIALWGHRAAPATVEAVRGTLLEEATGGARPALPGAPIRGGTVVRSGAGSSATLRLEDGSEVELDADSDLRVTQGWRATEVHLEDGRMIVAGTAQAGFRFVQVSTRDLQFPVAGAVFVLHRGPAGSRVSVIAGRVAYWSDGRRHALGPGQQEIAGTMAGATTAPVSLRNEVAWSRNAPDYLALLGLAAPAEAPRAPEPAPADNPPLTSPIPLVHFTPLNPPPPWAPAPTVPFDATPIPLSPPVAAPAPAAPPATPSGRANDEPLAAAYAAVLRPNSTQVATIENVAFDWESLHFVLQRGELALTAPVGGRVTAAIFIGAGELDVQPPNAIEAQQMRFFTGKTPLAEPFTQAVFRFADGDLFLRELRDQAHFRSLAPGAEAAFDAVLTQRARMQTTNALPEGARLLVAQRADVALPVAGRLFYADLKTPTHDWIEAEDDPMRAEAIRVHAASERPIPHLNGNLHAKQLVPPGSPALGKSPSLVGFDDTWTQFAVPGASAPTPPWAFDDFRLTLDIPRRWWDYHLETRALRLTASIQVRAAWDAGDLILLHMDSHLRPSTLTLDGQAVDWLQPPAPASEAAPGSDEAPRWDNNPSYQGNWLLLRLPRRLSIGDEARLEMTYQPADDGDLDFLSHNPLWYPVPALAPNPVASFDFTASSDPDVRVIAAGTVVRDERVSDQQVTEWKSPGAVRGFGFSIRTKIMDSDRKLLSETVRLEDGRAIAISEDNKNAALLEEIGNALRFMDHTFGPYPYAEFHLTDASETYRAQTPAMNGGRGLSRLESPEYALHLDPASNLPAREIDAAGGLVDRPNGRDAPAWAELSEISPLSRMNAGTLAQMGLRGAAADRFLHLMPAEMVARQWFGVSMGAASDRDRWLMDGLAHAAGLLFVEKAHGPEMARAELRGWQSDLLQADIYSRVPNSDGPLALGPRLGSSKDPLGRELVEYEKAAYVLYMLRQMMAQPNHADPDDAFIAMMHAFTAAWQGRNPSTADFEAVAERYMTLNMDVNHDHSLQWFFHAYVDGNIVPRLNFRSSLARAADKVQVRMSVDNPDGWHGLLPVYLLKPDGSYQRGWLPVVGPKTEMATTLDFEPTRVVPNMFDDMLVRLTVPAK